MIGILIRKLTGLGRDENGAALMVTLALFLFMYLSGAGVFAIGKVVKDRVHLQNACDAAAYSAAVVQADTLSRIATINRAMAWTYVSMTRRQMDYIIYRWLDKTLKMYGTTPDPKDHLITLNGTKKVAPETIRNIKIAYENNKKNKSFYSHDGSGLKEYELQIDDDKRSIREMYEECKKLRDGMEKHIAEIVKKVVTKNMEQDSNERIVYFLKCTGLAKCMDILEDEKRFTKYAGIGELDHFEWFEEPIIDDPICRNYTQGIRSLISEWNYLGALDLGPCRVLGSSVINDRCSGEAARPLILNSFYFGETGTITVGLAKYNENPWYRILKTKTDAAGILKGIFAAFNPYKYMEWTWAFSSAKAGYKYKGDEEKDGEKRKYRIDWREGNQSWNLCQSDWDAVFVSVRRAVSQAKDGEWIDSNVPELGKWITDEDGWKKLSGSSTVSYKVGDMPALPGMDWNEDGDTDWSIAGDDERGRYSGLNWHQEAALIRDSDGAGGNMLWKRLAEMLYH